MTTTPTLAASMDSANPAAGIYFVPSDGSVLAWEDLRMQLQYLSEPGCYPQALVAHAQAHWSVYAEDFRAVLADFVAHPYDYADDQRTLHLYAGFLLAQFRDAECFSLAQDLMGCTDRQLREGLGEDYEEPLVPWLAAFCHQDTQRLQWLADAASKSAPYSMQNRQIALQALARCAVEGVAPRSLFIDTAMAFCRSLIAGAQDGVLFDTSELGFGYDTYVSFGVADLLDVELPREILPELQEWFALGHVDPMTLGPDELLEAIDEAEQRAASHPPGRAWPAPNARGLLQSIDQEFGRWGMFKRAYSAAQDDDYAPDMGYQEPYVRSEPKVGRNDPCPCGSGKKYKKCCGG